MHSLSDTWQFWKVDRSCRFTTPPSTTGHFPLTCLLVERLCQAAGLQARKFLQSKVSSPPGSCERRPRNCGEETSIMTQTPRGDRETAGSARLDGSQFVAVVQTPAPQSSCGQLLQPAQMLGMASEPCGAHLSRRRVDAVRSTSEVRCLCRTTESSLDVHDLSDPKPFPLWTVSLCAWTKSTS